MEKKKMIPEMDQQLHGYLILKNNAKQPNEERKIFSINYVRKTEYPCGKNFKLLLNKDII